MTSSQTAVRQRWMAALAKAETQELEAAWAALPGRPAYDFLRRPEIGLAMVRGRADGDGRPFNLGEMTMTRCAVRLDSGAVGLGYVAGRKPRHAELMALLDGLLLDDDRRDELLGTVIAPLELAAAKRRAERQAQAAATRVEFFTMVRGAD